MSDVLHLKYTVCDDDFTRAGEASSDVKKRLKQLAIPPEIIRKVSIALYEGEINMVIHANGGTIDVYISEEEIKLVLADVGPGIPDVNKAMEAGYSTAPDNIRTLGFGAGMGLPNMQKNSDDMQIDTTVNVGTTVTMIIRL